jgi:SAM-dependent methyltransferase
MIGWLLESLRCVAPAYPFSPAIKEQGGDVPVCHGRLEEVEQKLVCVSCGSEYGVEEGVPKLLGADAPVSSYGEEFIRQYYEMHFGPFLRGEGMEERLRFPRSNPGGRGRRGAPKRYVGIRAPDLEQAVGQVFTQLAPTEIFYEAVLEMCQRHLPAAPVALDLGCGLGRMTAELARHGAERVIGMDLSLRMVKEANRLLVRPREEGARDVHLNLVAGWTLPVRLELDWRFENIAFVGGNAERIPLGDEQVDFVLCLNLIDRVTRPRLAVSEMARVLKPHGRLLISDPYHWDSSTPEANRTADMASWFQGEIWEWIDEVDGVPFLVRPDSRRLILYMSHCIVYEKKGESQAQLPAIPAPPPR